MPLPELKARMQPALPLKMVIERAAPTIRIERLKFEVVPERLLWAIAFIESAGGALNVPKHEPAYAPGGFYYKRKTEGGARVRTLWNRWGDWAACSYSSFQILFVVAVELGFLGSPIDLWHDEEAIVWVVNLLNERIIEKKPESLEQIADAYNSGSFRDRHVPHEYIAKFIRAYDEVKVDET